MDRSRSTTDPSDSATFYPEDEASSSQGHPTSFSYLPPGAPPWPTTVPQQLPYVVEAAPAPQVAAVPAARTGAKPRRSVASILSIIAVLILTPLLGAAATFGILYYNGAFAANTPAHNSASKTTDTQTTAGATPTAVQQVTSLPAATSYKQDKETTMNLSLEYPSDWTAGPIDQSGDPIALPIQAPQQYGINFVVTRFSSSTSSTITNADEVNSVHIQALAKLQGVHTVTNVTVANTQPTIGGTKWAQKEATFMDSSNAKIHFTTITALHNKDYYSIYFFVPDTLYQDAMQKYLQHMLNSLQFLS